MQTISLTHPVLSAQRIVFISVGILSVLMLASCGGGGSSNPTAATTSNTTAVTLATTEIAVDASPIAGKSGVKSQLGKDVEITALTSSNIHATAITITSNPGLTNGNLNGLAGKMFFVFGGMPDPKVADNTVIIKTPDQVKYVEECSVHYRRCARIAFSRATSGAVIFDVNSQSFYALVK